MPIWGQGTPSPADTGTGMEDFTVAQLEAGAIGKVTHDEDGNMLDRSGDSLLADNLRVSTATELGQSIGSILGQLAIALSTVQGVDRRVILTYDPETTVFTFSTPQDLDTEALVQFKELKVGSSLAQKPVNGYGATPPGSFYSILGGSVPAGSTLAVTGGPILWKVAITTTGVTPALSALFAFYMNPGNIPRTNRPMTALLPKNGLAWALANTASSMPIINEGWADISACQVLTNATALPAGAYEFYVFTFPQG